MVTEQGQPVEFFFSPGGFFDGSGLYAFEFDMTEGFQIAADKANNNYPVEDLLDEAGIQVTPFRKKNSKHSVPPWVTYLQFHYCKMIETTGSLLNQLFPKKIHATSTASIELTVTLFIFGSQGLLGGKH